MPEHPISIEEWARIAHVAKAEVVEMKLPDQAMQIFYDKAVARLLAEREKEHGNECTHASVGQRPR